MGCSINMGSLVYTSMKKLLLLPVIIALISSCSSIKNGADNGAVTLTGQIVPLGMTSFQYGTHLLKAGSNTYALKSSKVRLDDYLDKKVKIKGAKVSGYPLEGGPELIEVSEVSVK